ncbi:MAG TPA: DUF3999 domain-containing protein [Steroidobacteraceae bacterium]
MKFHSMRYGLTLILACAIPLAGLAQQQDEADTRQLKPEDFAYGLPIRITEEAAGYRVPLPLIVYRTVVRTDKGDVRVFNGSQQVVPHTIERPRSTLSEPVITDPLPLFVLRGEPSKALESIRITIDSGRAHVDAKSGNGGAGTGAIRSYVLDGRSVMKSPIAAFQLSWPDDAPDYAGRMRIEASDDLGNWRVVVDSAPIAHLRAGEARLTENRIEIPRTASKFWRLSWTTADAPFEITSVVAELARGEVEGKRESLAVRGTRVPDKPGEFEFDLGARVPADRVNLDLPERNTIVEVTLFSRSTPRDTWKYVTRSGFYRLQGDSADASERVNGALTTSPNTDRYWLARVEGAAAALGDGIPQLRVEWLPDELVFLARGEGPYTLAFGSAAAAPIKSSLYSLPGGARILHATFGEPHALGGESRLQPIPQKMFSVRSVILWGVLGAGIGVLALMAYRLARELK